MSDIYIADACRTPMGKLGGQLALVRPDDLAAHAVSRLMGRNPELDPMGVEDIQWGAANQAGEDNRNVARMTGLLAGLPIEVPDGWGDVMVAGGSESMSRAPYVTMKAERGFPTGPPQAADTVLGWRLVNSMMEELYPPLTLGMTAEVVAEKYSVSREDQDAFALRSHTLALESIAAGRFDDEIEPIEAPVDHRRREMKLIETDEGPRSDTSLEKLGRLRPVFKEGGVVTAGNSSPMNDGAAALLLATEKGLEEHGLTAMARIVASAAAGVHPDVMGMGPVPSSEKALRRAGLTVADLDLVELNEAFASQSVASTRELGLDPDKVNVNGGAIAIGHPLGASGARILVTLVHELRRRQGRYGLATMCIGVGQGIAMVVERV
jgi:acetyl-CoA acetyltransferase family protein